MKTCFIQNVSKFHATVAALLHFEFSNGNGEACENILKDELNIWTSTGSKCIWLSSGML